MFGLARLVKIKSWAHHNKLIGTKITTTYLNADGILVPISWTIGDDASCEKALNIILNALNS